MIAYLNGSAKQKAMLYTSFYAQAIRLSGFPEIKRKMGALPHAVKISEGSKLRYGIRGGASEAVLELGKSHISYTFYFDAPSAMLYGRNLLAFISILAFVQDDYEVKLGSIYGYVTYALANGFASADRINLDGTERLRSQAKTLNAINTSLARELFSCQARQKKMEEENLAYRAFVNEVKRAEKLGDGSAMLNSLGVNPDIIRRAYELAGAR
ncbi:MAG: hypothetical protein QXW10_00110 [Candidatus Micrarchaeaceae archaeon]